MGTGGVKTHSLSDNHRLRKALEATAERRIKKYVFKQSRREYWIVVGKIRDYLVIPDKYCTCDDFFINVVTGAKAKSCYHLLAQRLAESEGSFETYEVDDDEGERLLDEWLEP